MQSRAVEAGFPRTQGQLFSCLLLSVTVIGYIQLHAQKHHPLNHSSTERSLISAGGSLSSVDLFSPVSVNTTTSDYYSSGEEAPNLTVNLAKETEESLKGDEEAPAKKLVKSLTVEDLLPLVSPVTNGADGHPQMQRVYKLALTGGPCGIRCKLPIWRMECKLRWKDYWSGSSRQLL